MKTLYLIRHGETDHNASGRTMGQMDIPLNARGQDQAAQTAAWLRQHPIERIVSSDLSRALGTAEPLGHLLNLPVEPDPRLRELSFGIFEGQHIADYIAISLFSFGEVPATIFLDIYFSIIII